MNIQDGTRIKVTVFPNKVIDAIYLRPKVGSNSLHLIEPIDYKTAFGTMWVHESEISIEAETPNAGWLAQGEHIAQSEVGFPSFPILRCGNCCSQIFDIDHDYTTLCPECAEHERDLIAWNTLCDCADCGESFPAGDLVDGKCEFCLEAASADDVCEDCDGEGFTWHYKGDQDVKSACHCKQTRGLPVVRAHSVKPISEDEAEERDDILLAGAANRLLSDLKLQSGWYQTPFGWRRNVWHEVKHLPNYSERAFDALLKRGKVRRDAVGYMIALSEGELPAAPVPTGEPDTVTEF